MTAAQLSVIEERRSAEVVLILAGEIDIATVSQLRAAAERAVPIPPSRLILDFGGVTFCDSQGLSTLITLNREVSAAGGRLVLANVSQFMWRLFEITGLRAAFEFADGPA